MNQTDTFSWAPVFACLVSLSAVVPIILFGEKHKNLREASTLLAAAFKFGIVCTMITPILAGKTLYFEMLQVTEGISLAFRVDGLGLLFAIVASLLWIVTSLYSIGYMRGLHEHAQTRYYCFFALALSSTLGVAFAANLLTLYVFYELLSISTWPLVTHHQDKDARKGGRTYLTYLLGTSVGFLLPAMIFCYVKSGGSNPMAFVDGGFIGDIITSKQAAVVLLLLFVFGFAKAGLMPFHSWLPGAMVAPTPVSALLHAVAVVKVGVFCIIRVFTGVFELDFLREMDIAVIVSWIAAFTVIVSSLIALSQDNLKRRLAFSTIGQLSYIILGVSLLSPMGQAGSMMHIAMHALGKITLFMCVGAIFVATGKKNASEIKGLGRKMPITFTAFLIGALSVTGLPPTGGFISKWYLLNGTLQAGEIALLLVFLISTLLNAYYLLKPVWTAFFVPEINSQWEPGFKEAPLWCVLPPAIASILTLVVFFYPTLFMKLADTMTHFIAS
jgi:multicomponent Na+:H+ antiporter subunit D